MPRPPLLSRLPYPISRFLGYRPPSASPPYPPLPIPPFRWLPHLPLIVETYLIGFIGAFTSIVLIEISMSYTHSAFNETYHSPIIVASFGASAVLVFGALEAPLAQPRALVGGQFVSALIGVCLQRLFGLINSYQGWVDQSNTGAWHPVVVINGALSMALALLAMQLLNVVHPPAGATALIAATSPYALTLSWRYLPVVLVSSLIMLGWALINNNTGRRRYPSYWWAPTPPPAKGNPKDKDKDEEKGPGEAERGRGRPFSAAGAEAVAVADKVDRAANLGTGHAREDDSGLGGTGFHKPAPRRSEEESGSGQVNGAG